MNKRDIQRVKKLYQIWNICTIYMYYQDLRSFIQQKTEMDSVTRPRFDTPTLS